MDWNILLYGKRRDVCAYDEVVMLKTLKRPVRVVWVFRKTQWIAMFTTDLELSVSQIIEYYGAEKKIEVYFKEAKQHLGFLKEQGNHYAAYIASIHLTAIRFCLLVIAKQTQGAASIALMRQKLCSNSADISFASKLWQVFVR